MEQIDADKAIYGAVKGWAHGKQKPETFVAYAGSALAEGTPLRAMLAERFPSATFTSHHSGDRVKLLGDDGVKFMAALGEYRDTHNITDGLAR